MTDDIEARLRAWAIEEGSVPESQGIASDVCDVLDERNTLRVEITRLREALILSWAPRKRTRDECEIVQRELDSVREARRDD